MRVDPAILAPSAIDLVAGREGSDNGEDRGLWWKNSRKGGNLSPASGRRGWLCWGGVDLDRSMEIGEEDQSDRWTTGKGMCFICLVSRMAYLSTGLEESSTPLLTPNDRERTSTRVHQAASAKVRMAQPKSQAPRSAQYFLTSLSNLSCCRATFSMISLTTLTSPWLSMLASTACFNPLST